MTANDESMASYYWLSEAVLLPHTGHFDALANSSLQLACQRGAGLGKVAACSLSSALLTVSFFILLSTHKRLSCPPFPCLLKTPPAGKH
jgi:hypothetical protein